MLNDVFVEMWFALKCGKYIPQVLITHFITLWRLSFLSHLLLTVFPSWQRTPWIRTLAVQLSSVVADLQHVQDLCHARLLSKVHHAMSYLAYISTYSGKLSHLNGRKRDRRRVEASYISCAEPCLRAFPFSLFCTLSACWLPDAQFCDQIIHVRNFGSLMKIACCAHATLLFVRTSI